MTSSSVIWTRSVLHQKQRQLLKCADQQNSLLLKQLRLQCSGHVRESHTNMGLLRCNTLLPGSATLLILE